MSQTPSSNPPHQDLPPGTQLEEFVIEKVLGSGGFGITYLARDKRLGRKVVIKENLPAQFCWREQSSLTVHPRHSEGEDLENFRYSLESFEREASTLASLDHPGIVKVLRSFEANGTAYFVMPFVEGIAFDEVTRERHAQRENFSEDEISGLLWRVLDALSYLHDRGIYHRDIKPGNLLIAATGEPVLIDFGAARQRLSEKSLTVIESAGYTPFEQLQSRGKVGPWSDIYALGGMLYKAVCGQTPAKAADRVMDDPVVPLAGRPELRGHFSPRLLESIDKAMSPNAANRFQSCEEWRAWAWSGTSPAPSAPLAPAAAPAPAPAPEFTGDDESRTMVRRPRRGDATTPATAEPEPVSFAEVLAAPGPPKPRIKVSPAVLGAVLSVVAVIAVFVYLLKPSGPPSNWNSDKAPQEEVDRYAAVGHTAAKVEQAIRILNRATMEGRTLKEGDPELTNVVEIARAAADSGHPRGMALLGRLHLEGLGMPKDEAQARQWVQKAADAGDLEGMCHLGHMLEYGLGGKADRESAFKCYLKAAEGGHPVAMSGLGSCYEFGMGVPKNEAEAFKWYEKGSDAGDPPSMTYLGECYENGVGTVANAQQAVAWYQKAADAGDLRAMVDLGRAYAHGTGVKEDGAEAIKWIRKAAEAGDTRAMDNMGRCYARGIGVTADLTEAAHWYRKAADLGNAEAMYDLGLCHERGKGVNKDPQAAVKWHLKAVDAGYLPAMNKMGVLYEEGFGVVKDGVEAMKWFRKGAEAGHSRAMWNLGRCYTEGIGSAKDDLQAVEWYRKSADAGYASGMNSLGTCYENGRGVREDKAAAVALYRKAAELGNTNSMVNLAMCHELGTAVEKSPAEAARWYQKAAEGGNTRGMTSVGICYATGFGLAKDAVKGTNWFRKAAEAGDDLGMLQLGYACHNGEGVTKDATEALKWFRLAADAGNTEGMNCVGWCYSNGSGVAADEAQATAWYQKAAEAGNTAAMHQMGERYRSGIGVGKDAGKAVEMYAKSVDHEDLRLIDKLQSLVIPRVQFKDVPPHEALEYLMVKSRDADTTITEENKRAQPLRWGVTVLFAEGAVPPNVVLDLDLKDVPLRAALQMVADLLKMKMKVERQVVLFAPY